MGKITVTNKTDSAVVIEWRNGQARVEPRCKQTIEAEKDSPIRIYNDETPSKLCFGRCLSRESVKDVWRFGPVALINFDSFYKATGGNEHVEITEKTQSSLFILFRLLYFNGKPAEYYDYHGTADRKRMKMLSSLCLLPLAIISMMLLFVCIYGLITEFSFESFMILLLCAVPAIITAAMIKAINRFINFKKNFHKNIKNSKEAKILAHNGRTIKYSVSKD